MCLFATYCCCASTNCDNIGHGDKTCILQGCGPRVTFVSKYRTTAVGRSDSGRHIAATQGRAYLLLIGGNVSIEAARSGLEEGRRPEEDTDQSVRQGELSSTAD